MLEKREAVWTGDPCGRGHMRWQWHPGLATQLWGFSSPCRHVPSVVGPGVHGAGGVARGPWATWVLMPVSWTWKWRFLTRLGSLRCEPLPHSCSGCGTEPLLSSGRPSRPAAPQAALDGHTDFPHSPPAETGGRRKSEGRKEGEKKRPGEVRWEEVEGRQGSNMDTNEQAERPSHACAVCLVRLHPSRPGEAALINDFTSTWQRC